MPNTKLHAISAFFLAAILVLSCGHDRGRRTPIGFEDEARDTIFIHFPELSEKTPKLVSAVHAGDYFYFHINPPTWKAVSVDGVKEKDLPPLAPDFTITCRHDSLLAYNYKWRLIFDPETWKWKEITATDGNMLYQDDDWAIRRADHGEFGSASWFIDKHSGAEYAFLSLSGKVHRTDSCFFFVKATRILGIPDPSMGFHCDSTTCYEKAKDILQVSNYLLHADYLERRKGYYPPLVKFDDASADETSWSDDNIHWINAYGVYPYAKSDTMIINSFMDRGSLYCLLDTPQHTVLTKLDGNHLSDVHAFSKRFNFRDDIPCIDGLDYPIVPGNLPVIRNDDGTYELLQLGSNYSRLIHVQFR